VDITQLWSLPSSGFALLLVAVSRRVLPILISLAGACLIGLLIYGVSTRAASRTLDEAVAQGKHPIAPEAARTLPGLAGARTARIALDGKEVG